VKSSYLLPGDGLFGQFNQSRWVRALGADEKVRKRKSRRILARLCLAGGAISQIGGSANFGGGGRNIQDRNSPCPYPVGASLRFSVADADFNQEVQ